MSVEIYLAFVVASTLLIIAPGPTNLVIVSGAMQDGFRQSLWVVGGAAVSHTLLLTIATLGLVAVLAASAQVFEIVRWIGVGYLIWLGLRHWFTKPHVSQVTKRSGTGLWLQGFLVNTTNPKALFFYGAFFPPFIDPSAGIGFQFALLGATFILIFVLVGIGHAYAASLIGHVLSRPRLIKIQNRISGTLLIGAGLFLATAERPRA